MGIVAIHYNKDTGEILGAYPKDIYNEAPTPNIEVEETSWSNAISLGANFVDANGNFSQKDFRTQGEIDSDFKKECERAIGDMLDAKAKELRYDNILSARSYAGYPNPFQEEALTLAEWAAACWAKAGELEAIGTATTVDEFIEAMPALAIDADVAARAQHG